MTGGYTVLFQEYTLWSCDTQQVFLATLIHYIRQLFKSTHKVLKYFKELTFLSTGPGFSIVCTAMPAQLSIIIQFKYLFKECI